MSSYVGGECFLYTAQSANFLEVTVHHLIAGYRKQCPFLLSFLVAIILFEDGFWDVKQGNVLHNLRFLTRFAYPHVAVIVGYYMLLTQIGDVDERQSGECCHDEHVAHHIKCPCEGVFIYKVQFMERQECRIGLNSLHLDPGEWILGNPFVCEARLVIFFTAFM